MLEFLKQKRQALVNELQACEITPDKLAEIEKEVMDYREQLIEDCKEDYADKKNELEIKINLIDELVEDVTEVDVEVDSNTTDLIDEPNI